MGSTKGDDITPNLLNGAYSMGAYSRGLTECGTFNLSKPQHGLVVRY